MGNNKWDATHPTRWYVGQNNIRCLLFQELCHPMRTIPEWIIPFSPMPWPSVLCALRDTLRVCQVATPQMSPLNGQTWWRTWLSRTTKKNSIMRSFRDLTSWTPQVGCSISEDVFCACGIPHFLAWNGKCLVYIHTRRRLFLCMLVVCVAGKLGKVKQADVVLLEYPLLFQMPKSVRANDLNFYEVNRRTDFRHLHARNFVGCRWELLAK